jgi:hypothetical protein
MKKYFALITGFAALCACQKVQEPVTPEENAPEAGNKQIITALVNCPTKVTYSENTPGGGAGISSVWSEGDTFYAIQDGSTVVTFTLSSGAGSTSAAFTAEAEGVTASTEWVAVLGKSASVHGTEVHCGYTGQNGTIANLNKYNYVTATGTGLTPSFNFEGGEKLSYIVRLKLPAGIKCIEYTSPATFKVQGSGPSYFYAKGENDPYSNIPTTTITLSSTSATGDLAYIAVPAINHNSKAWTYNNNKQYGNMRTGVIVTLLNNTSAEATQSNGSVIDKDLSSKGGQVGTWDMSEWTLITRPKPSDAIEVVTTDAISEDGSSNYIFDLTGTDTFWAPFNLGASTPEGKGNYYGWGEITTPEERGREDGYTFPAYSLRGQPSGANTNYYNYISVYAAVETPNLAGRYNTIRGGRYDVARVKWGSAWRMPGFIEAYATWKKASWTTVNGQGGLSYGGVFLPGYNARMGTNEHQPKGWDQACIWSADQFQRNQGGVDYDSAYIVGSTSGHGAADWWRKGMKREWGLQIRPVLASSTINVSYRGK